MVQLDLWIVTKVVNDFSNYYMPVIIDESTNRPVCGAWLFFGTAAEPPSSEEKINVIANFFEINAGIAENKELMNFLVVNLLNYINQFANDIHAAEFMMRQLTYGMIPDFCNFGTFKAEHLRTIEKVGGYLGNEKYYLDAVGTFDFYKFDQTNFAEEMKKLIASEPIASERKKSIYGSGVTLGYDLKPIQEQDAYDHAIPERSDMSSRRA